MFEVALVAPVQEAKVTTVDDEPRWAGISLNHVTKFRVGIFQPGRWMRVDGVHQKFIKVGSLEFGMTSAVNLLSEFKNLGDVFTGHAGSHQGCRESHRNLYARGRS